MDNALKISIILLIIYTPICIYFLIRNQAIYNFRIRLINEKGLNEYIKYLPYQQMMYKRFWDWNFEEMKNEQ